MEPTHLRQKVIAEAIGTFALVFFGCGSVMIAERFPGTVPSQFIPIVFGGTIGVMIYALGHISGGHFNPAVTLALGSVHRHPRKEILTYWMGQFSGAIIATFLLVTILPAGSGYGENAFSAVSFGTAWIWEVLLTFFLVLVIMGVATDATALRVHPGTAIGATIILCGYVGGPITGASMNPARSFGPALVSGDWAPLAVYLTAPFVGGILAAVCYESFLRIIGRKPLLSPDP